MSDTYEFYMVTPLMMPSAIKAAKEGVTAAQTALLMIERTIKQIEDHPLQCMCLDCQTDFSSRYQPGAFAVVIPMFPHAGSQAVACGVCRDCVDRSDLEDRIIESLRTIWPSGQFTEVAMQ